MDWKLYPNFSRDEMQCRETGECLMDDDFMKVLQDIRNVMDMPMVISSGYRSVNHSLEVDKRMKGEHTMGLGVDVRICGASALKLVYAALMNDIKRIGIMQHGMHGNRFVHLGYADKLYRGFPAGVWTYSTA